MTDKFPRRVFVSHAYRDKNELRALQTTLPKATQLVVFEQLPPNPGAPVSTEIIEAMRRCKGLVYLGGGASQRSRWVEFEKDYAARLGLPVFAFARGRLTRVAVEPVALNVVMTVSPKSRRRASRMLKWMARERNFVLSDLGIVQHVPDIPIHYLDVLYSGKVALWLLDELVAGMVDMLATTLPCDELAEVFNGEEPLPPAPPHVLARIDPHWNQRERDADGKKYEYPFLHRKRILDLTGRDAGQPFDWTRVDELIVRLTSLSLRWKRTLDRHPEWQPAYARATDESFESSFAYFCRQDLPDLYW